MHRTSSLPRFSLGRIEFNIAATHFVGPIDIHTGQYITLARTLTGIGRGILW
jgi:hypothetical protein